MHYHPLHDHSDAGLLREFACTENPDVELLCDRLRRAQEKASPPRQAIIQLTKEMEEQTEDFKQDVLTLFTQYCAVAKDFSEDATDMAKGIAYEASGHIEAHCDQLNHLAQKMVDTVEDLEDHA